MSTRYRPSKTSRKLPPLNQAEPKAYKLDADLIAALQTKAPQTRKMFVHKGEQNVEYETKVVLRAFPVCWGLPMDETLFSIWFANWIHLPIMPWDTVTITMSTYLPDARNLVHKDFLKTKFEWLVMLDSDVLPPPDFLQRLLAHNKKIVGGWYKTQGGTNQPVVYDFVENKDGINYWDKRQAAGIGLEKVGAAGAGIWLMHHDVAQALGEKPYDMNTGGEDMVMCAKLRDLGIDIWIDWSIAAAHAGVGVV